MTRDDDLDTPRQYILHSGCKRRLIRHHETLEERQVNLANEDGEKWGLVVTNVYKAKNRGGGKREGMRRVARSGGEGHKERKGDTQTEKQRK